MSQRFSHVDQPTLTVSDAGSGCVTLELRKLRDGVTITMAATIDVEELRYRLDKVREFYTQANCPAHDQAEVSK